MYGTRRMCARDRLDRDQDYVVVGGKISFRQTFETVEAEETFCRAPDDIINAGRRLLTLDVSSGISALVHNTVVVNIGCNNIPLFAMVCGGRGRALFSFRRVYSGCSAFIDILCCLMSTPSSGSSWGFPTVTDFQRFRIASRGTRLSWRQPSHSKKTQRTPSSISIITKVSLTNSHTGLIIVLF